MPDIIWSHKEYPDEVTKHSYEITDDGFIYFEEQSFTNHGWAVTDEQRVFMENKTTDKKLDFIYDALYCLAEDYGRLNA